MIFRTSLRGGSRHFIPIPGEQGRRQDFAWVGASAGNVGA